MNQPIPGEATTITVKYQELTDDGVPRFPVLAGVRNDEAPTRQSIRTGSSTKGSVTMSTTAPRRFEFVGGNSRKFWEVCVQGHDVHVRFGRIGADGQTSCKSLASPEAAAAHAAKLVQEKIAKGYAAVA